MSLDDHSPEMEESVVRECHPPSWLSRFGDLATRAFHSTDRLAPVGCHFHLHEEADPPQWEVTLFVSSTEIYGGAFDGQRAVSRFMLDLSELKETFDVIENFYWQAQTMAEDDQLGPHIGVEGTFEGHSVWLRVTAEPPSDFQPGRAIDLYENKLHDRW